jgi:alpha-beta hydrolase superfamily lysophospholipase
MVELQGSDFLYRRWDAPAPRGVFLLVHGLGAHTARWDFLAGHFAARGFPCFGLELRGFGASPERPRGHIDSFRLYEEDILALRRVIAAEHSGKKVFLLGESLGGLIAFNLAARRPEEFAGQVLIAPAYKNGMKFPLSSYFTMAALYPVKPRKTVAVPFTSKMCTRDPEYRAVMDANPLEVREASLRLLMATLGEQRLARRNAPRTAVPVLYLAPGDDRLVDARAGKKMFTRMGPAAKRLIDYPDMLHALSIDLGRERVFEDILDWAGGLL